MSTIDINRIMEMIPHRYPILLVDRVLELMPGESATSLKNVTMNEPHFMGHFPGYPVMPGVLIVEAMAQTAAIVVVEALGAQAEGKVVYFMTIDNARFRRPVTPGDSLHIHVEKLQSRAHVWKFKGTASVEGKICAEATFSAMITDKESA
ncbi:MAG TPA: 3-hydroxyacyl-ACP dehydratase FabZ [Alphaproteobacteria bacterium]|nr:3-hydroxyacyl-ACP dehydratase FabZ [Alphaproteobacteria bacterium]USO06143.1 MAG: 3-hydroxyacyl-ACP dehydratase FabZ [Rhodospirillales bacterium]HOO82856.1 3-hydroxyacyl-ACP dehydratase FabZ [Alphaproteobacteria bacterium]